jgi:hypothetical protein
MVRSRRVPSRTIEVIEPFFTASGVRLGTRSNRVILYDSTLAYDHLRAIDEGHKISCSLGLKLEIVDLARSNFARRLLSAFGLRVSKQPALVVKPYSNQSQGNLTQVVPQAR